MAAQSAFRRLNLAVLPAVGSGQWWRVEIVANRFGLAHAVTDGTTIYVLGALSGTSFTALGVVYSLTPGSDTQWNTRAPMLGGRERGAAVVGVVGGKIYVAGGQRDGQASTFVDVYDPVMNTWTALAD